jgi:hypothetical protein
MYQCNESMNDRSDKVSFIKVIVVKSCNNTYYNCDLPFDPTFDQNRIVLSVSRLFTFSEQSRKFSAIELTVKG